MASERTDGELVSAIARGDDRAFAEFVDRHGAWAMGVGGRLSGNRADGEDSVQESLLFLIERASTLVVTDSIRPWLYTVIRRRAQHRRRDRRAAEPMTRTVIADHETVAAEPDERLRRAVASLSDPVREVLYLRVVDGLSVAQTALALEIPEGTVKSRLAAALASLRRDPSLGLF